MRGNSGDTTNGIPGEIFFHVDVMMNGDVSAIDADTAEAVSDDAVDPHSIDMSQLGCGDCQLFTDIFTESEGVKLFHDLMETCQWSQMMHKGGPAPRMLCTHASIESNGVAPIYRHPSDDEPTAVLWNEASLAVKRTAERVLSLPEGYFNHALIQCYRNGIDCISEHADKTLDIAMQSPIVNVSLGCTRVFFRKSKARDAESGARLIQRVPLRHSSLFVLGWQTNRCFLHGIKADKRRRKVS